jgi:hypothetical protein
LMQREENYERRRKRKEYEVVKKIQIEVILKEKRLVVEELRRMCIEDAYARGIMAAEEVFCQQQLLARKLAEQQARECQDKELELRRKFKQASEQRERDRLRLERQAEQEELAHMKAEEANERSRLKSIGLQKQRMQRDEKEKQRLQEIYEQQRMALEETDTKTFVLEERQVKQMQKLLKLKVEKMDEISEANLMQIEELNERNRLSVLIKQCDQAAAADRLQKSELVGRERLERNKMRMEDDSEHLRLKQLVDFQEDDELFLNENFVTAEDYTEDFESLVELEELQVRRERHQLVRHLRFLRIEQQQIKHNIIVELDQISADNVELLDRLDDIISHENNAEMLRFVHEVKSEDDGDENKVASEAIPDQTEEICAQVAELRVSNSQLLSILQQIREMNDSYAVVSVNDTLPGSRAEAPQISVSDDFCEAACPHNVQSNAGTNESDVSFEDGTRGEDQELLNSMGGNSVLNIDNSQEFDYSESRVSTGFEDTETGFDEDRRNDDLFAGSSRNYVPLSFAADNLSDCVVQEQDPYLDIIKRTLSRNGTPLTARQPLGSGLYHTSPEHTVDVIMEERKEISQNAGDSVEQEEDDNEEGAKFDSIYSRQYVSTHNQRSLEELLSRNSVLIPSIGNDAESRYPVNPADLVSQLRSETVSAVEEKAFRVHSVNGDLTFANGGGGESDQGAAEQADNVDQSVASMMRNLFTEVED